MRLAKTLIAPLALGILLTACGRSSPSDAGFIRNDANADIERD